MFLQVHEISTHGGSVRRTFNADALRVLSPGPDDSAYVSFIDGSTMHIVETYEEVSSALTQPGATAPPSDLSEILKAIGEIKVTLDAINAKLDAIDAIEGTLPAALSTIAANIQTIKDELANASGGISAADAAALATRIEGEAANLQTISDSVAAVQTESAP